MGKICQSNKDKWYLHTDIPRVGDARGKAILFRRFGVQDENLKKEFGISASFWSYNTTDEDRGQFAVQDFCEVNSAADLPKKIDYVKTFAKDHKNILLVKMINYSLTLLLVLIFMINNVGLNLSLKQ